MEIALHPVDWALIVLYVAFAIGLGAWFRRRASASVDSFFVADRKFPWWLAGTSIVATTFAADTPLAVTGIVASGGIAGNWIWWCWGIAHLTGTFFFARLWRRSRVITDAEITELRYGGRPAAALRGFKAIYNGVFINCLTMAWVIAAMVKISRAFFDLPPGLVIATCIVVTVIYTSLGGIRGVVVTDFLQFGLGLAGAILLAIFAVGHFGGLRAGPEGPGLLPELDRTLTASGQSLDDVLAFVPGNDHPTTPFIYFVALLLFGGGRSGWPCSWRPRCRGSGCGASGRPLACPSHQSSTAMPYLPASAALCSVGHPRRTSSTPAVTSVAKHCSCRQLRHFATRPVRRAG